MEGEGIVNFVGPIKIGLKNYQSNIVKIKRLPLLKFVFEWMASGQVRHDPSQLEVVLTKQERVVT